MQFLLQVITARHCDEVRKVVERLGHLREGGPALDPREAGACLLLNNLDIFLQIRFFYFFTFYFYEGDLSIIESCDGILEIRDTFLLLYFSVVINSSRQLDTHLIAQHSHYGNIAGDGLAQGTKNLRRGTFLLTAYSRLQCFWYG